MPRDGPVDVGRPGKSYLDDLFRRLPKVESLEILLRRLLRSPLGSAIGPDEKPPGTGASFPDPFLDKLTHRQQQVADQAYARSFSGWSAILYPVASNAPAGAREWATAYGLDVTSPFPFAELKLDDGVVMRWRWIPPGNFLMSSSEADGWEDESPQHEVELTRGFWLAETPCTQAQWVAVMHSNPSRRQGEQRPVENVSWEDCQRYCARLNERFPDLAMRLPTEAEWEYACRAGTTSAFNDGSPCTSPAGADPAMEALGWYAENSGNQIHSVAQKAANSWGLFDMHGNVWEWCADWWQRDYQGADSVDPSGPPTGRFRVIRGGSAWDFARNCRSAYRSGWLPGERFSYRGFRPAAGQPVSKEPLSIALGAPGEAPDQPSAKS